MATTSDYGRTRGWNERMIALSHVERLRNTPTALPQASNSLGDLEKCSRSTFNPMVDLSDRVHAASLTRTPMPSVLTTSRRVVSDSVSNSWSATATTHNTCIRRLGLPTALRNSTDQSPALPHGSGSHCRSSQTEVLNRLRPRSWHPECSSGVMPQRSAWWRTHFVPAHVAAAASMEQRRRSSLPPKVAETDQPLQDWIGAGASSFGSSRCGQVTIRIPNEDHTPIPKLLVASSEYFAFPEQKQPGEDVNDSSSTPAFGYRHPLTALKKKTRDVADSKDDDYDDNKDVINVINNVNDISSNSDDYDDNKDVINVINNVNENNSNSDDYDDNKDVINVINNVNEISSNSDDYDDYDDNKDVINVINNVDENNSNSDDYEDSGTAAIHPLPPTRLSARNGASGCAVLPSDGGQPVRLFSRPIAVPGSYSSGLPSISLSRKRRRPALRHDPVSPNAVVKKEDSIAINSPTREKRLKMCAPVRLFQRAVVFCSDQKEPADKGDGRDASSADCATHDDGEVDDRMSHRAATDEVQQKSHGESSDDTSAPMLDCSVTTTAQESNFSATTFCNSVEEAEIMTEPALLGRTNGRLNFPFCPQRVWEGLKALWTTVKDPQLPLASSMSFTSLVKDLNAKIEAAAMAGSQSSAIKCEQHEAAEDSSATVRYLYPQTKLSLEALRVCAGCAVMQREFTPLGVTLNRKLRNVILLPVAAVVEEAEGWSVTCETTLPGLLNSQVKLLQQESSMAGNQADTLMVLPVSAEQSSFLNLLVVIDPALRHYDIWSAHRARFWKNPSTALHSCENTAEYKHEDDSESVAASLRSFDRFVRLREKEVIASLQKSFESSDAKWMYTDSRLIKTSTPLESYHSSGPAFCLEDSAMVLVWWMWVIRTGLSQYGCQDFWQAKAPQLLALRFLSCLPYCTVVDESS